MTAAELVDALVAVLSDAPIVGTEPVQVDTGDAVFDVEGISWTAAALGNRLTVTARAKQTRSVREVPPCS